MAVASKEVSNYPDKKENFNCGAIADCRIFLPLIESQA